MVPNNFGDTPLSIALERHNNGIVDKIIKFCEDELFVPLLSTKDLANLLDDEKLFDRCQEKFPLF